MRRWPTIPARLHRPSAAAALGHGLQPPRLDARRTQAPLAMALSVAARPLVLGERVYAGVAGFRRDRPALPRVEPLSRVGSQARAWVLGRAPAAAMYGGRQTPIGPESTHDTAVTGKPHARCRFRPPCSGFRFTDPHETCRHGRHRGPPETPEYGARRRVTSAPITRREPAP